MKVGGNSNVPILYVLLNIETFMHTVNLQANCSSASYCICEIEVNGEDKLGVYDLALG